MENLFELDKTLLQLINMTWSNSFFDWFFPAITDLHKTAFFKFAFVPALFVTLVYKRRAWGMLFFVLFILSLATADAIGGQIIKPFFERLRPNVAGLEVILRAHHFNGFSFTSNHAANMFTAAAFFAPLIRYSQWVLYPLAILVAYSRVYCGVHYPSDVIFGGLMGFFIGSLFAQIFKIIVYKWPIFQGRKNG